MAHLARRLPDLALVLFGCALRATMWTHYPFRRAYDFDSHWKFIAWFASRWTIPDASYSRATYQPPLYYAVAALLHRCGVSAAHLPTLSIAAGCLRLGLFALALSVLFPRRPLVRWSALGIAAVLPASVHLDGMINPEALLGLFSAAFLLCAWRALDCEEGHGRARWAWWLAAGACAALALWTKISVTAAIVAVAIAAAIDVARRPEPWRDRARRLAPFCAALALVGVTNGWYLARNVRLYGKPFLTGFDCRERAFFTDVERVPLWQRRSPGYVLGWTLDIYRRPTWPAGYQPTPRFFPVLVASTFADYYRYAYAPDGTWSHEMASMPTRRAWDLARLSIAAGTLIALLTVAALAGALVAVWRRRRAGELALLLAPIVGVAAQLAFAWRYAVDWEGPVKGVYTQFAALPLCALFGLALDWCWQRRGAWRLVTLAGMAATGCVAAYTLYCRLGSPRSL